MSIYWWLLLLAATLAYSAFVSVRVLRSDIYDSGQKRRQLLIVWSFPLLGAFLASGMLRQAEMDESKGEDSVVPKKAVLDHGQRPRPGQAASAFVAD